MIQTVKVFLVYRIHPRYKQDVAERLVLGALHVAYGRTDVTFQGPFPTGISANINGQHTLDVEYNHGQVQLKVKNTHGFEVSLYIFLLAFLSILFLMKISHQLVMDISSHDLSRSTGMLQHAKHNHL